MFAARSTTNPKIITSLVRNGADVNARGEGGTTALMFAAMFNTNPEIITTLVRDGADVHARGEDGTTALMAAAYGNTNSEIINALLENGASPRLVNDEGKTAFDYAKENEALKNTEAYWRLNELRYGNPTKPKGFFDKIRELF